MKLIELLTFAILIKFSHSQAFCEFGKDADKVYTCILTNATVLNRQEEIQINGNHGSTNNDSLVHRLTTNASVLRHITPTIFTRFPNLLKLELENVGLAEVTSRTFFNCNNLEVLNFSDNNLTFILTGTFHRCRNLLEINLSGNNISLIEIDAFQNLQKLRTLNLQGNLLDVNISAFTSLPNLRTLNLASNYLIFLNENLIHNLSINSLILSDNDLIYIPVNLFINNTLTRLDLDGNRLTLLNQKPFLGLVTLRNLNLQRNSIIYVHQTMFTGLYSVRNLRLYENDIVAIDPYAFDDLHSLETLDLSHNMFASVTSNPRIPLATLTHMTTLELSHNSIFYLAKGFGLSENVNLINLYLNNNKIYYIHSKMFEKLDKLSYLQLSDNNLIVLPHELFFNNQNLRSLYISNNFLTRLDSILFQTLHLTRFDAINNTIDEIEGNFLAAVANVSILRLSGNKCISRNFANGTEKEVRFFTTCFENYENSNLEIITMPSPTTPSSDRKNLACVVDVNYNVLMIVLIIFIIH